MRQTDTRRKISLAGLPVELDERERFTGCGAGNNRQSNTILARNELGVLLKRMNGSSGSDGRKEGDRSEGDDVLQSARGVVTARRWVVAVVAAWPALPHRKRPPV